MFLRLGLIIRIVMGTATTLLALGGAIHLAATGKGDGGAAMLVMAFFFAAITFFRYHVLQTEAPSTPVDRDTWLTFDVRPTGITAPDGTIWLPRWSRGRVEALTGPRGESSCTVEYLDRGPESPLAIGLRSPDGSAWGVLGTVAANETFALVDGSGRNRAWLEGDGRTFELHSHGRGSGFAEVTVIREPGLPSRGAVSIDLRTPVWATQLCAVYVLSCHMLAEGPPDP